ncbi:rod shape-determining protein MreD [Paenibacillus sp. 481]|uniref:rod shape-determining protein MreD n=1 Tax=Paenibacillus sp. 481 TaxID=2835869 RepID=UPI001E4A2708|nr:rod shape-determining protein MreD [Paenibacillus sp. 481]UHA74357.1 rod shape-determining protein MreD [Paenibacillus sp. 481]
MNQNWMIGFMFILFMLEGTLLPFIIPDIWQGRIVPQFVFIIVLYYSVYKHRHTGLLMGLGFGLLQDIVYYGHMIGPHAFSMGLLGYLTGLLIGSRKATMVTMMVLAVIGSFSHQIILFGVYALFGVHQMPFKFALIEYMVPSLFIQLLFAMAVYVSMRKWFDREPVNKTAEEVEA